MPVYALDFAGTHCTYPQRGGQAELTWVAGYRLRWFTRLQTVTHPSTNQARRRVTSLMKHFTKRLLNWTKTSSTMHVCYVNKMHNDSSC